MTKPQQFKGRVAEHILLNDKYQYIDIELVEPHLMEFLAGQYVSIDVGGGERRSYSIASAPAMNHAIELCVDITPGGKGSSYLKNLKPGDEVRWLGPLGKFVLAPLRQGFAGLQEQKLLFVATGSGIAPLRSMVLDLLERRQDKREIWLYWGLRSVKDMFWEEDFRLRRESFANFNYQLLLSQPPENWPLESGHVTRQIKELGLNQDWGVYLCGNPRMMEEIKQLALETGVPQEQVHFEKFY